MGHSQKEGMNQDNSYKVKEEQFYVLSERDFYPPEDTRTIKSGVCNIHSHSFSSYLKEFFELLEEEEIFD